jgi:hypothetical protein
VKRRPIAWFCRRLTFCPKPIAEQSRLLANRSLRLHTQTSSWLWKKRCPFVTEACFKPPGRKRLWIPQDRQTRPSVNAIDLTSGPPMRVQFPPSHNGTLIPARGTHFHIGYSRREQNNSSPHRSVHLYGVAGERLITVVMPRGPASLRGVRFDAQMWRGLCSHGYVLQFVSQIVCEMRNASCMSRLLRNPRRLILLCCPILLAGCQHPLAPSMAGQQPGRVNHVLVDARPVVLVDKPMPFPAAADKAQPCMLKTGAAKSPKPKDISPAAQKDPDSQTGQLADSLFLVFKTFTGRQ